MFTDNKKHAREQQQYKAKVAFEVVALDGFEVAASCKPSRTPVRPAFHVICGAFLHLNFICDVKVVACFAAGLCAGVAANHLAPASPKRCMCGVQHNSQIRFSGQWYAIDALPRLARSCPGLCQQEAWQQAHAAGSVRAQGQSSQLTAQAHAVLTECSGSAEARIHLHAHPATPSPLLALI